MNKRFKLTIENPCSQKWSDFENRGDRGFCSSCQKEVIDFTKMSDSEIRNYFKDLPQNVCGKLRPDQMKIYGDYSPKRGLSKLWAWPFAAMATFFSVHTTEAQTKDPVEKVIVPPEIKPKRFEYPRLLTGTVKDFNGNPLINVDIVIDNSNNSTKSDSLGNYQILVPNANSIVTYSLNDFIIHSESGFLSSPDIILKPLNIYFLRGALGGITACSVHTSDFHQRMDRTKELIMLLFR